MSVAAAQPRINNFFEWPSRAMRKVRVLNDRDAGQQECGHGHAETHRRNRGVLPTPANSNARTPTTTQTASTGALCSRRPKKNIIEAPKAGRSGISQM